jgi:hypothetical protein
MNYSTEIHAVAKRVLWFEQPEEALSNPRRFLAYLMTYGTVEEVLTAKKYFSERDFEAVLEDPPAGIFDARSWTYWNSVYKSGAVPPLPQRRFP